MGDLFDIRQGPSESLKSYLDRFNKATLLVEDPGEKFFVAAFMKGLHSGSFCKALTVWKPRIMDEVRVRVDKHIEAEESNARKREKRVESMDPLPNGYNHNALGRTKGEIEETKAKKMLNRPVTEETYTPLNAKLSTVLDDSLHDNTIRSPAPFVGTLGRNSTSYCRCHRADGHTTDDCWMLKQRSRSSIREGTSKKL